MKILILSASIGSGHTRAADALAQALAQHDVEVIDFMSASVSRFNELLKRLYLSVLSWVPDLYDRIYRWAGARRVGPFTRLLWSILMYLPFDRLISARKPDVVICTHPFPEAAASLWKFLHVRSAGKFMLAAVLTDYSLHEIWLYSEVDVYFVATNAMKHELERHAQRRQKIFADGIPIDLNFDQSQRAMTERTLMIMGGGLGLGSIERTLKDLETIERRLNIIVVAGRNEKLIERLRAMSSRHELTVLGYVDNVQELMQQSALLITKPGALTMTEAFALGLPMILHAPIPGPEALNAKYAVDHGAARSIVEGESVSNLVDELLSDRSMLERMSAAARRLGKPSAATDIARHIIELIKEAD
ncbi:MAG: glycosyltransferase [Selenomonadaceae bacterium]|nr:glycosyltransferase [Selenomonadaceae bacterium]